MRVKDVRGCPATDTMSITARMLPDANLGNDIMACADCIVTLHAPDSVGYTYLWNDNTTTVTLSATPGSEYWLRVTDSYGCINSDTIVIGSYALPVVNLGDDADLCPGGTTWASPFRGSGYTYLWSTGQKTQSIQVLPSHSYTLTVTDAHGCAGSDEISFALMAPPEIDLGQDTTVCNDHLMVLPLHYTANGNKYLWSTGNTEPTLTIQDAGVYTLALSNNCYTVSDTISIYQRNCSLWFPSGFTPNGDGKNDIAKARGDMYQVTNFRLSVYNRWGRRIYYGEDMNSGWDGTYKGTPQDIGTYNYMIQYDYKGYPQRLDGAITLVR